MDRNGVFTNSELLSLLASAGENCVSIYMPLVTAGAQVQQNPLRLRNLLQQADSGLQQRGLSADAAASLLAPLAAAAGSDEFWRHRSQGLALFACENHHEIHALPLEPAEQAAVGSNFEIRPLLPLAFDGGYFYLLAVNLGGAQLFSATRNSIAPLPLPDAPEHVENFRVEGEHVGVGFHSGTGRGGRTAMFYGYGQQDENRELAVEKFLEELADAVDRKLAGARYPLLLAGEAAQIGELRPKIRYPHLLPVFVEGNPRMQEPEALLAAALPTVEPLLESARLAVRGEVERRQGTDGKGVADSLGEVLSAAATGAVDSLFVREGYSAQGSFDADSGELKGDVGTEELVNLAAVLTVRNGGRAWLCAKEDMPGGQDIVAALRF